MMKSDSVSAANRTSDYPVHLRELLESAGSPKKRFFRLALHFAVMLAVIIVLVWSGRDTNVSTTEFIQGIPAIVDYVSRMFPPDWAYFPVIWKPTVETVQIAIWGTFLSIFLAVPLGFLAARNITPHRIVYESARLILNALRGVSELVFALIFVSAVGLGPFPGILALALHNAGMLGKFYAEAIEAVDIGPVEAVTATGSTWSQTIVYAIIPQVIPHFITYSLYRFEVSIRAATVLGLVGAGGIGFHLISSIRLFDYRTTSTVLIAIVLLVILTDYAGTKIRAKVI
jgi:phosphonate transport system permease protein